MKKIEIIIRDRSLDWFERLMNSPWLERGYWVYMAIAVVYFGGLAFIALAGR